MKKLMNKVWKKEDGFTLIELIIVIAILAIIAAIAIPNVLSAVDNSRKSTDITNAQGIANAAATVRAQKDDYSGDDGVINVTSGAEAGNITAGYADDIVVQLNGVAVEPKFKGASNNPESLVLTISDTGTVQVFATGDGAASTAGGILLYPVPDAEYDAN